MPDDYEIIERLMEDAREIVEELEYNEDISPVPELKIMFNGFGDDDELGEGADTNIETYYLFVHKDCLEDCFSFPEHELSRGSIVHGDKEVRIVAIFNVEEEFWDINFPEAEDPALDEEELSNTLGEIYRRHYE